MTTIASESDHDFRWRKWQEKSRQADRRTEKRMTVIFCVVAGLFLTLTLYFVMRTVPAPPPDHSSPNVATAVATPFSSASLA